jgi:hypothetical protein
MVTVVSITYIPLIREYNLSVILSVGGWFVVYYKLSQHLLRKENVVLYE